MASPRITPLSESVGAPARSIRWNHPVEIVAPDDTAAVSRASRLDSPNVRADAFPAFGGSWPLEGRAFWDTRWGDRVPRRLLNRSRGWFAILARVREAESAARSRGAFREARHIESGCSHLRLRVKRLPPDRAEPLGRPLAVDLDFGPSSAPNAASEEKSPASRCVAPIGSCGRPRAGVRALRPAAGLSIARGTFLAAGAQV